MAKSELPEFVNMYTTTGALAAFALATLTGGNTRSRTTMKSSVAIPAMKSAVRRVGRGVAMNW
jgi:hypothetical protein